MPIDGKLLQRLRDNDTSLTSLDLPTNNIRAAGAQALAAGLEKNTTLTYLELWGNRIGDALGQQIDSLTTRNQKYLKISQVTTCIQLSIGRLLLYKATAINAENNLFLALPLEIKEEIVKHAGENTYLTGEQQRLILNYAESKIAPVADKLTFFKVTKCDRIRQELNLNSFVPAKQAAGSS